MLTVKQLANLAGVTPRTLHYYDEINLLTPSQIGANGYRYYQEDAIFRLQQILLYRQMNLPLQQIKALLDQPHFNLLQALQSHRTNLQAQIQQLQTLLQTVDQTIQHLQGTTTMTAKQLFTGFNEAQQAEYEAEAMQVYDPAIVKASAQRWKNYSANEKNSILAEGGEIYQAIIAAIPQGAGSAAAQAGVARWRAHMSYFWTPNPAQLLAIAQNYSADPRFKANFDQMDERLADFMAEAVRIYLERTGELPA
jgi:DNA-binding transcriptional MerR regulator